MLENAIKYYCGQSEWHQVQFQKLNELLKITSSIKNLEELTDIAFSIRKSLDLVEDQRKELNRFVESLEKVIGALWVQNGDSEPIRTDFVTASPRLKMVATVPSRHKDPEAYAKLMQFYNIPDHLWNVKEEDHPVVSIHWPGLVDDISERTMRGLPLPDGLDPSKMITLYKVTFRQRKEITRDSLTEQTNEIPF